MSTALRRLFAPTLLRASLLAGLVACGAAPPVLQAPPAVAATRDTSFVTTDGVRLHARESGPAMGPTLLLVPGWTMPAWIWDEQLAAFGARLRVVALDPRGQGDSDAPPGGYDPARRGADIGDVVRQLGPAPVVLVGWSLGVLDALSWVREGGGAGLAGFVAIDNSVGEYPPPVPGRAGPRGPRLPYEEQRARFVQGMFRTRRDPGFLDRLTAASLRTPRPAAAQLLSWPVPREAWREAVLSLRCPVLYLVRPGLAAQAASLAAEDPRAETVVWPDVGHAMFVDAPGRFDALLSGFLARLGWR